MVSMNVWELVDASKPLPDFNREWDTASLMLGLWPKLKVAGITAEEWRVALSFYEDTRTSPAPLRAFWEEARVNQRFLFRLHEEQGDPDTPVGRLFTLYWSPHHDHPISWWGVKGCLFDGLCHLDLLERSLDRAEADAVKASKVSYALRLCEDLEYSYKDAVRVVRDGIKPAMLRREAARRRAGFGRAGTTLDSSRPMRDFVLSFRGCVEPAPSKE